MCFQKLLKGKKFFVSKQNLEKDNVFRDLKEKEVDLKKWTFFHEY